MFKPKKKNLIYVSLTIALILLTASLIPAIRKPILDKLSLPFKGLKFISRETEAIIFYRRGFLQNQRLKKEIEFLRSKLLMQQEAILENKRLKDTLHLKQQSPHKLTVARVVGRSADNWSSVIIIDKGRFHGIRRGLVALSYAGLVGRVTEAAEFTSRITLINDPDISVSGIVQRSRQEGLVSGTLGSSLIMRYLPPDADIEVSDLILTSGLTGKYPKGLVIGRVVGMGEEFSGLSRYAIIRPAVNLSCIEEVLVIIS